jgi:hypothetical protein
MNNLFIAFNLKGVLKMKKLMMSVVLMMFVLTPMSVMAMSHGKSDHSTMDHSSKEMVHDGMDHDKMDHGSMGSHGDMEMLGSEVKAGVKASLMIKDTSEAMAKMGMAQTHHLMVSFKNEENGATIEKGTVAVKVINPDETENKPVKMMGMAGAFGADLALKQKGMYHFYIGTKLEDGTKRQYHFHTDVK